MTYVITEPCVGVKDGTCIDVCPVDSSTNSPCQSNGIHVSDADDMYFISPDECIDCGACEPICLVTAIFHEFSVPRSYLPPISQWYGYIAKNANHFG